MKAVLAAGLAGPDRAALDSEEVTMAEETVRESVAALQVVRGLLNEALQHLDKGMAAPNMDGYESLAMARESLMRAIERLARVEKGLTQWTGR